MTEPEGVPQLDTDWMPVYQEYKSQFGEDLDLWTYLNIRSEFDLAAAFSKLFWPDFIEVDGCVILKERYSPVRFKEWTEYFHGDRIAIETMVNHIHIHELFMNTNSVLAGDYIGKNLLDANDPNYDPYSLSLYDYLGKILLVCWRHALLEAFPERQFTFHLDNLEHGDPEITFHQGPCPDAESPAATAGNGKSH